MPEPFRLIPEERLPKHIGKKVHVQGWTHGCVFIYKGTIDGVHQLRTPRTHKLYKTTNPLCYTRMQEMNEYYGKRV